MNWQKQLQKAIKEPEELLNQLELNKQSVQISEKAQNIFNLLATNSYLSNIQTGNIDDPLLKQILPVIEEEQESYDFIEDPVSDINAQKTPGLLHKYHGRILLILTGACPIHCRYCFRRHYPYSDNSISPKELSKALDYIQHNTDITEVILSGGDPLILTDEKLSELIKKLENIKHLKRLRIHTRTPIVLPERILESNLEWLSNRRLKTTVVLHCNHKNEISDNVKLAIKKLKTFDLLLLNQSVLLKGVNDNVDCLAELSEELFTQGVQPYYLHQLDRVKGAMHFEVDIKTAKEILSKLRARLPGYLVPTLVKEQAGYQSKTPL